MGGKGKLRTNLPWALGGSRRGASRQQAPRRLAGSASGTSVHVSSQSVALARAFGVHPPVLSLRAEPLRRVSLSRQLQMLGIWQDVAPAGRRLCGRGAWRFAVRGACALPTGRFVP